VRNWISKIYPEGYWSRDARWPPFWPSYSLRHVGLNYFLLLLAPLSSSWQPPRYVSNELSRKQKTSHRMPGWKKWSVPTEVSNVSANSMVSNTQRKAAVIRILCCTNIFPVASGVSCYRELVTLSGETGKRSQRNYERIKFSWTPGLTKWGFFYLVARKLT